MAAGFLILVGAGHWPAPPLGWPESHMGANMTLKIYLSGEIHTDWREQIIEGSAGLDVTFNAPVTALDVPSLRRVHEVLARLEQRLGLRRRRHSS